MNYVLFVILWIVLGFTVTLMFVTKIRNPKQYGLFKVKNEEICKTCEAYSDYLDEAYDHVFGNGKNPEDVDTKTLVKRLLKMIVAGLIGCIIWPLVLFTNIVQIIDLHKYNKGS